MPRLTRDRTTWLTYAQLGLWGFFLYGFGPVVPLLRDEQGTSAAVAGLHSTGIAVGAVAGGALFAPVARRLGRGPAIWLGLAGVAAGVAALGLLHPLPATIAAVAVIATFGMMVISGVNVVLVAHHGPAAPAALAEANAACAGMGILAPLVIGAAVGAGLGWRPVMAAEVGLITLVALAALTFRVRLPKATPYDDSSSARLMPRSDLEPSAPAHPVGATAGASARLPRAYWIAWVLMSVTGSIEVCLSLWTADVLRTHAGLSAGGASAAVAAIVCGMFAGRAAGGRFALRLPPVPLLLGALSVSLVGFALFWSAQVGWLAVTGLVVLGLGNALHYPLAISIALTVAGPAADKAAGWSSYSMGVGFGIAPVALGWVADGVGPHLAFLLLPGFIAAGLLLTARLGRVLRTPHPTADDLVRLPA
ncbi:MULTISPECIES: sugar MFS transporter [Micromonospora]|uniref:MFS transporter n=1 Tax=Micromonospora solifontis TaxID=2487138 RepID=A0ABX9WLG6_9ACTN|nr:MULTISPECIES: MFS transporter [Micromonospora]NES14361.1 MFS transporter [Micromonospora sp. PPF5-17B]NES35031.1 MFS transporter [Micromonospora solifontis]NES57468.1 MFS transporter [Micromonospora sp. PPF5-6]RNM01302.1 MFS transporter [Micromonospora solifontis]